jgi:hypothetical protein
MTGELAELPPEQCPNGHALGSGWVLVGWLLSFPPQHGHLP